ncbi:MAG: hypothetical protein JST16_12135 [Bdellovibrionales bacterium]|nr:hypothetical protein [Bdellovibrionales bacterium]
MLATRVVGTLTIALALCASLAQAADNSFFGIPLGTQKTCPRAISKKLVLAETDKGGKENGNYMVIERKAGPNGTPLYVFYYCLGNPEDLSCAIPFRFAKVSPTPERDREATVTANQLRTAKTFLEQQDRDYKRMGTFPNGFHTAEIQALSDALALMDKMDELCEQHPQGMTTDKNIMMAFQTPLESAYRTYEGLSKIKRGETLTNSADEPVRAKH